MQYKNKRNIKALEHIFLVGIHWKIGNQALGQDLPHTYITGQSRTK